MGETATIPGFLGLIGALCRAVARCGARGAFGPPEQTLAVAIFRRLTGLAARLSALAARLEAGTLRPPCQRTRQPAAPRCRGPVVLPRRRGLIAAGGHEIRGHAAQLAHFLNRPGMKDLVAADPRFGRILRPLCHLLAIAPPDFLRLPPREKRPRKPRPRSPKPARTRPDIWRAAWGAPAGAQPVRTIWLQRAPPKPGG